MVTTVDTLATAADAIVTTAVGTIVTTADTVVSSTADTICSMWGGGGLVPRGLHGTSGDLEPACNEAVLSRGWGLVSTTTVGTFVTRAQNPLRYCSTYIDVIPL